MTWSRSCRRFHRFHGFANGIADQTSSAWRNVGVDILEHHAEETVVGGEWNLDRVPLQRRSSQRGRPGVSAADRECPILPDRDGWARHPRRASTATRRADTNRSTPRAVTSSKKTPNRGRAAATIRKASASHHHRGLHPRPGTAEGRHQPLDHRLVGKLTGRRSAFAMGVDDRRTRQRHEPESKQECGSFPDHGVV